MGVATVKSRVSCLGARATFSHMGEAAAAARAARAATMRSMVGEASADGADEWQTPLPGGSAALLAPEHISALRLSCSLHAAAPPLPQEGGTLVAPNL